MTTGISPIGLAIISLVACEEATAELYAAFAQQLPAQTAFWARLSRAEKGHAQHLRDIMPAVHRGEIKFTAVERVSQESINTFLQYLRDTVARVQASPVPPLTALALARDIEGSFIERSQYELFQSPSETVMNIFHRIMSDTSQHREQVEQMWRQLAAAQQEPQRRGDEELS